MLYWVINYYKPSITQILYNLCSDINNTLCSGYLRKIFIRLRMLAIIQIQLLYVFDNFHVVFAVFDVDSRWQFLGILVQIWFLPEHETCVLPIFTFDFSLQNQLNLLEYFDVLVSYFYGRKKFTIMANTLQTFTFQRILSSSCQILSLPTLSLHIRERTTVAIYKQQT